MTDDVGQRTHPSAGGGAEAAPDPSTLPALSEAQTEIMNVVWERGEATLGDVWRALSARRKVAHNTVQTLLSRLVDKGWLEYRVQGKTFHYRAAQPREATLRHMARRLMDTAFRGSAEGLVLALLESRPLEEGEAARIRALIEQAERRSQTGAPDPEE